SDAGGTIMFNADGTLTGTDLRNELFNHERRPGPRRSGTGTWELTAPLGHPDAAHNRVHVRFTATTQDAGFSDDMRAETQDGVIVLAFYFGDPDQHDRYVFKKVPVSTPARAS